MKFVPFKEIQEDMIRFGVLATVALCLGLFINQFRDTPLALTYQTKQERMNESVSHLAVESAPLGSEEKVKEVVVSPLPESLPENLSLEEFQTVVTQKKALILDARPEMQHVVITGRGALPELIAIADTVTEMQVIKHAFKDGIVAQAGVEW